MTTERKADKWLDRKLERRTLLKKAAIGGASLAVLYVAPKFTSAGSSPAFASITGGGCTPGFWKKENPPTDWTPTGYTMGQSYAAVFNIGTYSELSGFSLGEMVSQGGGCPFHLGRHSVAALLNAALGTIGKTEAQVISETNAAFQGNCTAVENQKNIWDGLNNGGCRETDEENLVAEPSA